MDNGHYLQNKVYLHVKRGFMILNVTLRNCTFTEHEQVSFIKSASGLHPDVVEGYL